MDGSDERLYFLSDANMNVTSLVDTSGSVVERYVYDAYGKVTIWDATWSNTRSSSSYANCHLFAGYYRDSETGLYHVRNRVYLAELGRWVQRDPIGRVAMILSMMRTGAQNKRPFDLLFPVGEPAQELSLRAVRSALTKMATLVGLRSLRRNRTLLEFADGPNAYAFCGGSPSSWRDATGLDRAVYAARQGWHSFFHASLLVSEYDKDCCFVKTWWQFDMNSWFPPPDSLGNVLAFLGNSIASMVIIGRGEVNMTSLTAPPPNALKWVKSTCDQDRRLLKDMRDYATGRKVLNFSVFFQNCWQLSLDLSEKYVTWPTNRWGAEVSETDWEAIVDDMWDDPLMAVP